MITNFKFHSTDVRGLTDISAVQASQLINKYNIYYRYNPSYRLGNQVLYFDFDNRFKNIYQLYNLVNFNVQLKQIKAITFLDDSTVSFFTDYQDNKDLIQHQLQETHKVLISKKLSITLTNFRAELLVNLKDDDIKAFILSLEPYQTNSLFEVWA